MVKHLGRKKVWLVAALVALLVAAAWYGVGWGRKILRWRHLDATYAESFPSPAELAPGFAGRKVLFHVKTGLEQDDSQICVGFNIIFAALEAGAQVTVLFDAGALLDLVGKESQLAATGVPLRLRKVIAAQMNLPLQEMPADYGAYLELLHRRGAEVYANTAMLIVIGAADQVQSPLPAYPFVQPAPYATVAELLAEADAVIVY